MAILRVSVVIAGVLGIVACAAAPAPPPKEAAPLPAAAPAPPVAEASTKTKRTRTKASSPPAHDGTKPKNGRPLNPRDPLGRMVFVRADDHCFVEVPSNEKVAEGDIVQRTQDVDCPPEANDPAFDHCSAQIVLEQGTSKCYCVTGAGAHRPMPNPTPCPAH